MHDEQLAQSHPLAEHDSANPTSPERVQEGLQAEAAPQEVRKLLEELRVERAQLALERRLLECALPEAVKTQVRERYQGRIFEMSELERDLGSQRQLLADLSESGLIRGHGYEKPVFGSQITEAEKVQAAFDRMFDLEIDSRFGNVRGFTSIREAYARVTGDASVAGLSSTTQLGMIRVEEAAPMIHISEADTTTATFSYLLAVKRDYFTQSEECAILTKTSWLIEEEEVKICPQSIGIVAPWSLRILSRELSWNNSRKSEKPRVPLKTTAAI